jgi:hypothetical protein
MDDTTRIAAAQLARMRGMTRYYHERFFSDVRFSIIAVGALLLAGWWQVDEAFLLVPVVALIGAVATAFDASYLIFARQYAARLETVLNERVGTEVLVAAELETTYLFPLDSRKIVTAAFGEGFTWFGFVTLFYTAMGVAAFGFGLALGLPVQRQHADVWGIAYIAVLTVAGLLSLATGWWWFVGGEGEQRLRTRLDASFPPGGETR